jgi:class 3 adenylate cyclase
MSPRRRSSSTPTTLTPEQGAKLRRRLMRRSALVSIAASAVGAAMAMAYLVVLSPSAGCDSCDEPVAVEIAVVGGYFVIAAIVTDRLARLAYRGMRWLDDGRPPTDKERRSTLRLPGRIALLVLGTWVVAAATITGALAIGGADGRELARSATTITLVGLLISTFMAFVLERLGRPVFMRALEGEDVVLPGRWLGIQPRLLLGWLVSSAVPFINLLLLPFTTENEDRGDVGVTIFGLSVLGLVGGVAITAVAGRGIAAPLRDVRRALRRVGEGDLEVGVSVDASGELGQVQQGVNAMVTGLRERRRLQTLLGHHVGEEVAQLALSDEQLGSEQRDASALFVDIVGSTEMAERLPPTEVVERLNDLFDVVVRVVGREGGLVNKLVGDGALCIFGAPTFQPDHATRALRAARGLQEAIAELGARHPGFDAGVGVSSGTVVAGRVGSEERYEYTVIGGPVNVAARLTDQAKSRRSRALAAAVAVEQASPDERRCWGPPVPIELRGIADPVEACEPVAG